MNKHISIGSITYVLKTPKNNALSSFMPPGFFTKDITTNVPTTCLMWIVDDNVSSNQEVPPLLENLLKDETHNLSKSRMQNKSIQDSEKVEKSIQSGQILQIIT